MRSGEATPSRPNPLPRGDTPDGSLTLPGAGDRGFPFRRPRLSIGVRLTVWYLGVLALALSLFGGAMFVAMRMSIHSAVDTDLRARLEGVKRFMIRYFPGRTIDKIGREFEENSELKPGEDLVQIRDARGAWVFRSASILHYDIPLASPEGGGIQTIRVGANWLRVLTSEVEANGSLYQVQLATELTGFYRILDRFALLLVCSIPAVLLVATAGGYWISRRALAPVDEIIESARSISAQNLSERLKVPKSGDELERLTETLNQMIARLEAAFRKNSQFTGDASHELRTPIAVIRASAEIALRRRRSDADYEEALERILTEAERTSLLIENLMTLARADSGAATMELTSADLSRSVDEACRQGRLLAESRDVRFDWEIPDREILVRGEPNSLRRLFLILIDNALKYTPPKGHVSVSMQLSGSVVTAEVRDSGIGIPADDLPHIFERFYRADKARSRDIGGAGLGLAIARWIADAHGAGIQVESTVGQGSVFRVSIPLDSNGDARFS